MAMKQLYINGVGTGTYGIYISSDSYLSAPSIEYTEYQVPGRNGNLVNSSGRLNNIIRKFDCYIPNSAQANMDSFKKLLYGTIGYMRISSDYEPDTYQLGYLAEELVAEPFLSDDVLTVTFTIYFSCQPQKYYLTNTDTTVTRTAASYQGYVLPRSHPWMKTILKQTKVGDLPTADLFIMTIEDSFTSKLNSANIAIPNAEFAALVAVQFDPGGQNLVAYLAHSNNGANLKRTSAYNKPSGYTSLDYAIIVPYDTISTCSGTVTLDGTAHTVSKNYTGIVNSHITNRAVLGLSATYTYRFNIYSEQTDDHYTEVEGFLNGVQQWKGRIYINSDAIRTLLGTSSTANSCEIIIDSETLSAVGGKVGENRNLNEYVNIDGQIDGIADQIRVIDYNTADEILGISYFNLSPRWWKI